MIVGQNGLGRRNFGMVSHGDAIFAVKGNSVQGLLIFFFFFYFSIHNADWGNSGICERFDSSSWTEIGKGFFDTQSLGGNCLVADEENGFIYSLGGIFEGR